MPHERLVAKSYSELFNLRGSSYDLAMRRFPLARRAEFAQAIAAAQLPANAQVADVPAGGGYLQQFLPSDCTWLGHEPCASFNNHGSTHSAAQDLLPLPWKDASVDALISLAGIHHIQDKVPFLAECYRVIKPGGRLVISDVEVDSACANFLDEFVGQHNSTGHTGVFLTPSTKKELAGTGFFIESNRIHDFFWEFSNYTEMSEFCSQLFDLRTANLQVIEEAIQARLGTQSLPNQRVGMKWSLLTIVGIKSK